MITHKCQTTLTCDMDTCLARTAWYGHLPKWMVERLAREREGWRKDKLGRNICPAHPKLKGARRG